MAGNDRRWYRGRYESARCGIGVGLAGRWRLVVRGGFVWAVRTAPWFKIQDKEAQHVFLGMTVIVLLLWNSGASLGGGITFHLLLAALTTLMFGAQFAILCMSVALLGVTILGNAGWMAYGLNMVMMGVVPILIVWWIAILAYKYLDRNFFVFVLLNGFSQRVSARWYRCWWPPR